MQLPHHAEMFQLQRVFSLALSDTAQKKSNESYLKKAKGKKNKKNVAYKGKGELQESLSPKRWG